MIAPRELVTRPHVAGSATVRKRMVGGSTRCYQKTYGYVWLYEDEIRSVEGPGIHVPDPARRAAWNLYGPVPAFFRRTFTCANVIGDLGRQLRSAKTRNRCTRTCRF